VGRDQVRLAAVAIAMGGHVRVGLEDNIYYEKGRLARNEELVARVVRIARELGRSVAEPDEARRLLGIPPLGVGFSHTGKRPMAL
jgi:3-keto-5-aminohexanoate cleavage enzyme